MICSVSQLGLMATLRNTQNTSIMTYNYYIQGTKLRDLGAFVTESHGWRGLPKPRAARTEAWHDQDGLHLYGTDHLHHEARQIRLRLIIIPTEGRSLEANIQGLNTLLTPQADGTTSTLSLEIRRTIDNDLAYRGEVYRTEALDIEITRGGYATATLALTAPNP